MIILENPLLALIIALLVLIFFLVLFKILNHLEKVKENSKPKEKKSDSKVESIEKSGSEKSSDNKSSEILTNSNNTSSDNTKSAGDTNYLYDRFVISPTSDDKQVVDSNICSAFLDYKKADEIKNKKLEIHVDPVVDLDKDNLQKNIEKQKLLNEISSMSKEMKLLMLEDILKKM